MTRSRIFHRDPSRVRKYNFKELRTGHEGQGTYLRATVGRPSGRVVHSRLTVDEEEGKRRTGVIARSFVRSFRSSFARLLAETCSLGAFLLSCRLFLSSKSYWSFCRKQQTTLETIEGFSRQKLFLFYLRNLYTYTHICIYIFLTVFPSYISIHPIYLYIYLPLFLTHSFIVHLHLHIHPFARSLIRSLI